MTPIKKQSAVVAEESYVRPDRVGKKTVVGFVEQDVSDAIRIAAIETRSTVQMIVSQALENWVTEYRSRDNKKIVAQIEARATKRVLPGRKPEFHNQRGFSPYVVRASQALERYG